jgi:hypothetical protein
MTLPMDRAVRAFLFCRPTALKGAQPGHPTVKW